MIASAAWLTRFRDWAARNPTLLLLEFLIVVLTLMGIVVSLWLERL